MVFMRVDSLARLIEGCGLYMEGRGLREKIQEGEYLYNFV